jgi:hypothetical protein
MKTKAIIAAAAAFVAACTPTGPSPAGQQQRAALAQAGNRQCFDTSQIGGFQAVGRDRVRITTAGRTFELQTSGNCHELSWSRDIILRSATGSGWICQGLDAELLVPSLTRSGSYDRCLVSDVRLLSPEEARAR